MCNLKFLFLIISIGYVAGDIQFKACEKVDLKCLTKLIRRITQGFPEYNIPSVDPFHIPEHKMLTDHVMVTLTNVNVTGVSKQTVDEFKFYPDGKSVKLSFTTPIEINAEMTLNSKTPTEGHYNLKATVSGNAQYIFGVLRANEFEYLNIDPATIVGKATQKPEGKLRFSKNLRGARSKEADDLWHKHKDEINTIVIETIIVKSYDAVMNNIIAITKKLPKSSFFTDL